jgi:hypothetical protein
VIDQRLVPAGFTGRTQPGFERCWIELPRHDSRPTPRHQSSPDSSRRQSRY